MKISYSHLQKFFDGKLPSVEKVADALTFHAWEIEEVVKVGSDTVLDVKVLPDKSAWALSHRGVAKDLSVILSIPLLHDPLTETPVLEPVSKEIAVVLRTDACRVYNAAHIKGVTIGDSPAWLKDALTALGQRSINNVVDITNYVMIGLGQPLHAFDAKKLTNDNGYSIAVRNAESGETITTLTGETYTLATSDTLISDAGDNTPIGIAGIKGGKHAEVDSATVDIIIESANFDPLRTRKTSQRLKLRTDASTRYENGIVPEMTSYGLTYAVMFITKFCGGTLEGYATTPLVKHVPQTVSVSRSKINSVLGLSLSLADVEDILKRFGYAYTTETEIITITPPFERPDLVIPEDVIEEIGRVSGYDHVPSVVIEPIPLREVNKRFFYAEAVRDALTTIGFSEIFTSSFREHDDVKLKNALASDKGYLRSKKGIVANMKEALLKNAPNSDLFATDQICMFELGKVFDAEGERDILVLGVQSKQGYIAKKDTKVLKEAMATLATVLGTITSEAVDGIVAVDFTSLLEVLPQPSAYAGHETSPDCTYKPFSLYPYLTRDIAFWAPLETTAIDAEKVIRENAGALAQRIDMFDRFEKEGRVSYGFRIVFQSYEKTLTASDSDAMMQTVGDAVSAKGWDVR